MRRRFFSSVSPAQYPNRRLRAEGRIRLTFLALGVGGAVGLFLIWERSQSLTSFPAFETGRYVGTLTAPQVTGSLLALPLVVDVPAKGDPLLLLLDDTMEGGVRSAKLPQADGRSEPIVITTAGGEQMQLVGSREETRYRGIGTRASGGELQWSVRPVQNAREHPATQLGEYLDQRAKMALLDRRIESAKAGVAKASDESAQIKRAAVSTDQVSIGANGKPLTEKEQLGRAPPRTLDDERTRIETKHAELIQKMSLIESVAPGSRVARAAYRTLAEQQRWLNSVLLTAAAPSMNPEEVEAVERGIEVDKLQRAIVAAQRRIDAVLRASDDILGE